MKCSHERVRDPHIIVISQQHQRLWLKTLDQHQVADQVNRAEM